MKLPVLKPHEVVAILGKLGLRKYANAVLTSSFDIRTAGHDGPFSQR